MFCHTNPADSRSKCMKLSCPSIKFYKIQHSLFFFLILLLKIFLCSESFIKVHVENRVKHTYDVYQKRYTVINKDLFSKLYYHILM